jgi:hypothetical protein
MGNRAGLVDLTNDAIMRNAAISIGVVIFTLLLSSGCATPLDRQDERYETFPDALSACRQQEPNRRGQKYRLPATHPHIAECLRRHGWGTDGRRLDASGAQR